MSTMWLLFVLFLTIFVFKELWEIEELWNKFLHIIWIIDKSLPSGRDGMKLAICTVKSTYSMRRQNKRPCTVFCCIYVNKRHRISWKHYVFSDATVYIICISQISANKPSHNIQHTAFKYQNKSGPQL